MYDLNAGNLKTELQKFRTKDPSNINFKEFVFFLKAPRVKFLNTETSSKEEDIPITNNLCLLQIKEIALLEKIFNDLDRHQDFVVPLRELIKNIKNDIAISKILKEDVIYLPKIDKGISFQRFLYQLENEGVTELEKKEKEFISWNYFIDSLTHYYWKPYTMRKNKGNNYDHEEDSIDIEESIFQILKSIFFYKVVKFDRNKM